MNDNSNLHEGVAGLSAAQIAAYHEDGYLVIEDLYTSDEMQRWKSIGIEHLEGKQDVDTDTGKSGIRVWLADELPGFLVESCCSNRIVSVVGQLLASRIEFLSAKIVFKTGVVNYASYWHQDYLYWEGTHKISVWIALDDATEENGCLKVIPNSHRKLYTHENLQEETNILFHRLVEDELEGESVVTTELRSGSALFFHDQLVHSSHPNRSGADRFCFIPTYRSADEPDSSTIWSVSLPLEGNFSSSPGK